MQLELRWWGRGKNNFGRDENKLNFGEVNFEIPIRYPNGDSK